MGKRMQYLLLYIGAFIVCIFIGGHIIQYAITGVLTLASFVLIVESIPSLKWFIHKTNKLVDILIFCFAIYAKINFGVTVAMALMFAGLGFTMLYAPWIREEFNQKL